MQPFEYMGNAAEEPGWGWVGRYEAADLGLDQAISEASWQQRDPAVLQRSIWSQDQRMKKAHKKVWQIPGWGLLPIKLLVQEKDEEININFCPVK